MAGADFTWQNTARQMLGLDNLEALPVSLTSRLRIVDELCKKSGGSLHSRQAIATIIMQWKLDLALHY